MLQHKVIADPRHPRRLKEPCRPEDLLPGLIPVKYLPPDAVRSRLDSHNDLRQSHTDQLFQHLLFGRLGMGPDGKGKVNLPLISRHKFIHPSWKIGKNFIIKMHHHHAGTGPLGLPKLLHDTLYRPGSYRGDPPRHKAVKGCTGAIGTGKRTPPGGNDLIPQRMPLRVPPPQSIPLNQAGPWAAHHRNPIPINLLQYPANGLNHCLPMAPAAKRGEVLSTLPTHQTVRQVNHRNFPVSPDHIRCSPVQEVIWIQTGKRAAANQRNGVPRTQGLHHLLHCIQIHGAHHRQTDKDRLCPPHLLTEKLQFSTAGLPRAMAVKLLIKNHLHLIPSPLQRPFQIPHPQRLGIVKGQKHHPSLGCPSAKLLQHITSSFILKIGFGPNNTYSIYQPHKKINSLFTLGDNTYSLFSEGSFYDDADHRP